MEGLAINVTLLVVLVGLMYFTVVRPQQKMRKERQEMLDNLKVGDKIVTIGGIYGKITTLKEDVMQLEVAPNMVLKMQRAAVSFVEVDEKKEKQKEK
ncbi:MAG: preprotein translocase subunit YajC [Peptococcia bacterium]